jgi:sortase A
MACPVSRYGGFDAGGPSSSSVARFVAASPAMRRWAGFLLAVALVAGCGAAAGRDDASARVSAGASSDPVRALIATTTTTTAPPPPPPPAAPAAPREPRAPQAPRPARATPGLQVVARLIIPRLGLDTPVYEGDTLDVIDHGPGHFPNTALPGRIGNVTIAGHRVTHSRPFRNLDQLQPGDQLVFEVPSGSYTYTFTHHEIVTPDRVDIAFQTAEYRATLFACHPPGSARYRIVAHWKLASPPEPGQPAIPAG